MNFLVLGALEYYVSLATKMSLSLQLKYYIGVWCSNTSARVPECMFCGEPSSQKCSDCSTELPSASDGFVYSCSTCALRTHTKKSRKDHKLQDALDTDRLELYQLDLLSVICVETSHYVCFTRDPNTGTWLFFDSMANRVCK